MAAPDIDHIVYPAGDPLRTFCLPVGDGHELHVEEIGNPEGQPAVVLHGGPGSRIEDRHRRLFDPERYRLIAFDQRGAGRSTPRGEIRNNTTWHLVEDIEALRRHLGIEKWLVVGGSWGSTLSLLYAQTYPESVTGIVVWSVWLADAMTRRWFFEYGANMVRPEAWDEFVGHFTMEERDDLEAALYRRIDGADRVAAAAAARALGEWETSMVYFHSREGGLAEISGVEHAENYGRILSHYFKNRCFLDGDDHVLSRCTAIADIPGTIVQGRYDMCTPVCEAWRLKQGMAPRPAEDRGAWRAHDRRARHGRGDGRSARRHGRPAMNLSDHERSVLSGASGAEGARMAMEIVVETGRMMGADRLVPIVSSHIDGCLYHGDAGVLYCEKMAEEGARVAVPATTNVGSLNLLKTDQVKLPETEREMALRLMKAHRRMGCIPSWTCAPYQTLARPALGQQIAWGESNAVAFANTVLGARTNRYGDFLDLACAIAGRAPYYGLHRPENRSARLLFVVSGLPEPLLREDAFFAVLGALVGRLAGDAVSVVDGVPGPVREDQLKSFCAAAAATGAVALTHIVGVTPEAPDTETALGGAPPEETVQVTPDMIVDARDRLSLIWSGPIDCVSLGSPHFSGDECRAVLALAEGRTFQVPVYICLGRHTLDGLQADGAYEGLQGLGVEFVVDTCVVVTAILPPRPGVMMTNSAKFAYYSLGNTGYKPVFGTLSDCIRSAQAGHVVRDPEIWG